METSDEPCVLSVLSHLDVRQLPRQHPPLPHRLRRQLAQALLDRLQLADAQRQLRGGHGVLLVAALQLGRQAAALGGRGGEGRAAVGQVGVCLMAVAGRGRVRVRDVPLGMQ